MKGSTIIDDYQRYALKIADWSELAGEFQVKVFDTLATARTRSPSS